MLSCVNRVISIFVISLLTVFFGMPHALFSANRTPCVVLTFYNVFKSLLNLLIYTNLMKGKKKKQTFFFVYVIYSYLIVMLNGCFLTRSNSRRTVVLKMYLTIHVWLTVVICAYRLVYIDSAAHSANFITTTNNNKETSKYYSNWVKMKQNSFCMYAILKMNSKWFVYMNWFSYL